MGSATTVVSMNIRNSIVVLGMMGIKLDFPTQCHQQNLPATRPQYVFPEAIRHQPQPFM
jgi:hypothetical protein